MTTTSVSSPNASDGSRADFSRSIEANLDANSMRFESHLLSAFDVLLQLPIFDSEITALPADEPQPDPPIEEEADSNELSSEESDPQSPLIASHSPIRLPERPIPPIETPTNTFKQSLERNALASTKDALPVAKNESIPLDVEINPTQFTGPPASIHPVIDSNSETDTNTEPLIEARIVESLPRREVSSNALPQSSNGQQPVVNEKLAPVRTSRPAGPTTNRESDKSNPSVSKPIELPATTRKDRRTKDAGEANATNALKPTSHNRRSERLADVRRGERINDQSERPDSETTAIDRIVDQLNANETQDEPHVDLATIPSPAPQIISGIADNDAVQSIANGSPSFLSPAAIVTSGVSSTAPHPTTITNGENSKPTNVQGVGSVQGSSMVSQNALPKRPSVVSGGSTLTAYQENRVLQRVLKGLDQLQDGSGQVRLRLHPPELGSLQVTLRVEAQQVSAVIQVEHVAARDVLLGNLPQLQERMSDQGLNISQFDVQVVDPNQWDQGNNFGGMASHGQGADQNDPRSHRSSRYLDRLRNRLDANSTTSLASPSEHAGLAPSSWTRTHGNLDVRV